MKKIVRFAAAFLLSAVLAAGAAFPCLASQTVTSSDGVTATVSDLFYVFTPDNTGEMGRQLGEIGETAASMRNKLVNNHYLFLGVAPSLSATVFMSRTQDDVSRSIVDLIDYADRDTAEKLLVGSVMDTAQDIRQVERGGALFFRVECPLDSQDGQTDSRAYYVTVMNGCCYTLCLIDRSAAGALDENNLSALDSIFDTLEFTVDSEQERVQQRKDSAGRIFFWVLVPVALAAIVWICWSLSRDIQARRLENDRQRNIRRKPRR